MKKIITCMAGLLVIMTSLKVFAAFSDVTPGAFYTDSLDRVAALGIMNGTGSNLFKPNNILSREQFAKIVVIASGYKEEAMSLTGKTNFPDITPDSPFSGYINAAVKNGLISGMNDGKYHPREDVTFAQACTVAVKALGASEDLLQGQWPDNYIKAAKTLELTEGLNLKHSDKLPRWAAAVIIDRLWISKIKGGCFKDINETFGDSDGIFNECVILATSAVSAKLTSSQVLTDKGIYTLYDSKMSLELGCKYKFIMDGETIVRECGKSNTTQSITVDGINDNEITYTLNGTVQTMTLPEKPAYYYQGAKQNYDALKTVIFKGSTIIFAFDKSKANYEYAVILDPHGIYSGKFTECVILGNSQTSQKLTDNQVMTDKGIFYTADPEIKLEMGNKYGLVIKGDNIEKAGIKLKTTENITVSSILGNAVTYKDGDSTKTLTLPDKTAYYYDGKKLDYESVKTVIKLNTSIILAKNDNNTGYEYAIIADPVYSKPSIAFNYSKDIDFKNATIIKNGFIINQGDIEKKDVVYRVTDIWGENGYILVVNTRLFGILESISPNVLTPKTLKLAGSNTVYEISKDADLNEIKSFKLNDIVHVLLGYDGKVVGLIKA
jgi:hypothetical protein